MKDMFYSFPSKQRGLSGAEFIFSSHRVMKKFPGALQQCEYLLTLNDLRPSFVPKVWAITPEGYSMEILENATFSKSMIVVILQDILNVLPLYWSHLLPIAEAPSNWRVELCKWCEYFDLKPFLDRQYAGEESQRYIHGDPTLANVMYRSNGDMVLIDPIRPTGKIPGLPEVDVGKVLQSYIGWEHVLNRAEDHAPKLPPYTDTILKGHSDRAVITAEFWLMVHLLRILPYAGAREDIKSWCWKQILPLATKFNLPTNRCPTSSI
jgi:hypothetical protein